MRAGSRGAAGAARRARSPGGRAHPLTSAGRRPRRCAGREDDGRSRALRRRVTLIFGGYRGCPRQSTHDSTSSGGRAVSRRELGHESVSHALAADPRNRASDHPPSSRSVTEPRHCPVTHAPFPCTLVFVSSPIPMPVGGRPTGSPRARARSRRRSSAPACVPPPACGSADTTAVALYPQWR